MARSFLPLRLGIGFAASLALVSCGPEEDEPAESPTTAIAAPAASSDATQDIVEDAREAQLEAAARRDGAPVDPQTGQRVDAQIEAISWEYGPCTDAQSLLPPPPEGWGLLNDTPLGEWPIDAENARINYTYEDPSLEAGTPEYGASLENLSIYISSGTASTQALANALLDPTLREIQFEPGPYNYPVMRFGRSVLLGAFYVQLDGTGAQLDETFDKIIKCGIESGLIAEGVDPSSLELAPL